METRGGLRQVSARQLGFTTWAPWLVARRLTCATLGLRSPESCPAGAGRDLEVAATSQQYSIDAQADLQALRKSAGVSLEEIAEATKISIRFLSAIEHGRLDELPGGVFARSYIRQYSAAIGCDPEPLLRLAEKVDSPHEPPARQPARRAEPSTLLRFLSLG